MNIYLSIKNARSGELPSVVERENLASGFKKKNHHSQMDNNK